jgi:hypothetical protein
MQASGLAATTRNGMHLMLKSIVRAVLGIQGAFALFITASILIDPVRVAGQLGLTPNGPLGFATFRADIGSLFAAAGLFMLAAAILGRRDLLIPPMVLAGIALAIRAGSLAMFGMAPGLVGPMVVEAFTVGLLATGYFVFDRS